MKANKDYVEQVKENTDTNENKEDTELKEKVKLLEAVVQKMFLNVIKLEAKVTDSTAKPKSKVIAMFSWPGPSVIHQNFSQN